MAGRSIALRAAVEEDLPSIKAIHSYYAENTVITFATEVLSDEAFLASYRDITAARLPYIVAVDLESKNVVGYANAHGFRKPMGGYRHTVEISLFCHHEFKGQRIGTLLLRKLLDVLKEPDEYPEIVKKPRLGDPRITQVLACMAIDETGPKQGFGLADFYKRFGFVEVGHLKKVGYKHDRWYECQPPRVISKASLTL